MIARVARRRWIAQLAEAPSNAQSAPAISHGRDAHRDKAREGRADFADDEWPARLPGACRRRRPFGARW